MSVAHLPCAMVYFHYVVGFSVVLWLISFVLCIFLLHFQLAFVMLYNIIPVTFQTLTSFKSSIVSSYIWNILRGSGTVCWMCEDDQSQTKAQPVCVWLPDNNSRKFEVFKIWITSKHAFTAVSTVITLLGELQIKCRRLFSNMGTIKPYFQSGFWGPFSPHMNILTCRALFEFQDKPLRVLLMKGDTLQAQTLTLILILTINKTSVKPLPTHTNSASENLRKVSSDALLVRSPEGLSSCSSTPTLWFSNNVPSFLSRQAVTIEYHSVAIEKSTQRHYWL